MQIVYTNLQVVRIVEITDIKIRKINQEGKMKAIVSVTFDSAFVVHDIKVIEAQGKLFVAMPSRKTSEGEYKDVAHPINAEAREAIQKKIILYLMYIAFIQEQLKKLKMVANHLKVLQFQSCMKMA